jgi:tetratricopeptide (TPR) repeat protein
MSAVRPSQDDRGNPVGTRCDEAMLAAETALWRMVSGSGAPQADLAAARAQDPQWPLPLLMQAGLHLFEHTRAGETVALHALAMCEPLLRRAPPREQAHAQALQLLAEGRAAAASRIWDRLLVQHPTDLLALFWAQHCDALRGDAAQAAERPARVLLEWDEDDPLYPQVLGLWAMGLQEHGALGEAEDTARRALACAPAEQPVAAALHAVAHVMHRQGRVDDGAAWLRHHQPHWSGSATSHEACSQATHFWAHTALLRIASLDVKGALRIVDAHLSPKRLTHPLQRCDAAAVLWRLHLLGAEVGDRAAALAKPWRAEPVVGHAWCELHGLWLCLASADLAGAEHLLAQAAARTMAAVDAQRDRHAVMRDVALPLARAFIAFGRGEHDAAADALFALRPQAARCGGSAVDREAIDLTLMAACVRGQRRALGRVLANEHRLMRPPTPLFKHWADTLQGDAQRIRP